MPRIGGRGSGADVEEDRVRPVVAARRFGVSVGMLRRWANDGLIGRSRPHGPRGMVVYRLSEIRAHLDRCHTPPKIQPLTRLLPTTGSSQAEEDEAARFWARSMTAQPRRPNERGRLDSAGGRERTRSQ